MSGIGNPCSRAIWYAFRGYSPLPLDGRAAMIFDMGNRVEDAVIHWVTEAGYDITDRQLAFSAHNGFFRGHCDGVIHGITERPHILEIKSANAKKFKAFKDNGIAAVSPEYAAQVQCYMGYGGFERALWIVMCKDNCEIYTERAYFVREEFERLDKKALGIITAQDAPDPEPHMCEWCGFRMWCKSPDEAIQSKSTCGTCVSLKMGLEPECVRHKVKIKTWGISCQDWYPAYTDVPF